MTHQDDRLVFYRKLVPNPSCSTPFLLSLFRVYFNHLVGGWRKKKNHSGSISVQIIDKKDKYKVVKTVGVSKDPDVIEQLIQQANWWIQQQRHKDQLKLFSFQTKEEQTIEGFVSQLANAQVRTVGPELIFGRLFDRLGFNRIPEVLFRHLVITRLAYPASKLKTADYLHRYRGIVIGVDTIYRFLDKLKNKYQEEVEQNLQGIGTDTYSASATFFSRESCRTYSNYVCT